MDIKIDLPSKGLSTLEMQLMAYTKQLPIKCKIFVKRLADVGIESASKNTVTSLVVFKKQITEEQKYGCKAIMYGMDTMKIFNEWLAWGEVKSAEVSPLLMAEFGSGYNAENPQNIEGYGQGTFPNQEHAFDIGGWSWMDLDGNWHHSEGVAPTMPMYNAWLDMYSQVEKIAKEVFANA